MAKPTRKQPERRKSATTPAKGTPAKGNAAKGNAALRKSAAKPARGVAMRMATGMMRLALRNPAVFGGTAAFAVVFGFVAANALWYQPGHHPSPLLRTRLPLTHPDPARISMNTTSDLAEAGKVTTFLIEREDANAETPEPQPTPERTASVAPRAVENEPAEPADLLSPPEAIDPAQLVRGVQAELARRGFYEGEADGRPGPKTTAAVKRFERSAGRAETGIVSQDLLQRLRGQAPKPGLASATTATKTTATPAPRPTSLSGEEGDPVAAAIRAADEASAPAPSGPASSVGEASRPGMVMTIQRGLVNLAYADVTVDGVAGDQTRAAIRDFEKHYRLPETGEPSGTVLKKMKDIGAI